jgi:hypothetical protein
MNRLLFQPRLEVLEDRYTPSTFASLLPPGLAAGIIPPLSIVASPTDTAHPGAVALHTHLQPFGNLGAGDAYQGILLVPGEPVSYTASGVNSVTGPYTGSGTFTFLGFTSATTGTFEGTFVFVAANGDKFATTYGMDPAHPATFTLYPTSDGKVIAVFVAQFTPDPANSTGQFKNVTGGSFTMVAVSTPFVPVPNAQGYTPAFDFVWEGEGALESSKPTF